MWSQRHGFVQEVYSDLSLSHWRFCFNLARPAFCVIKNIMHFGRNEPGGICSFTGGQKYTPHGDTAVWHICSFNFI